MEIRQETDMYETIVKPAIIPNAAQEVGRKEPYWQRFKGVTKTNLLLRLFILYSNIVTKPSAEIYLTKAIIVNN